MSCVCLCWYVCVAKLWAILKSVSTRAPGSRATCHLTDFNETLPVLRVYPKTHKDKVVSVWFFPGEDRPLPRFFMVFTEEIASK